MNLGRIFILFLGICATAFAGDPYHGIQRLTLNNGMTVVFVSVPNSRQIDLELKINSGWKDEEPHSRGVAHLLEHTIQRDARLGAAQTYSNLFREEVGGSPSGVTSWKNTSFAVTVPSLKGIWALNEFHRMIFSRQFSLEDIDRARQEVWREIGQPKDPLLTFLEALYPPKWVLPDFFSTEFSVDSSMGETDSVRNNIRWLSLADLKSFYSEHYVPSNMTLFYSGPFKGKETFGFIKETFEKEPAGIEPPKEEILLKPRTEPYLRSAVTRQTPWASVGTKFWDIEPQDEISLQILFETLMDGFAKEVATHSSSLTNVEKKIWVDEDRYGYAVLNFELGAQDYSEQLRRINELIKKKAFLGELSEVELQAAKKKIRKRIEDWDGNSDVQLKLAQTLLSFQQTYETELTPLEVLDGLTQSQVTERLTHLFQPERSYLVKWEPPISFKEEAFVFWAAIAFFTLLGFRFAFARNFPHTKVRYVRKLRYRPIFILLAVFIYLNILWAVCQLFQALETHLLAVNLIQGSYLVNQYLETGLFVFVIATVTMFFLGSIPRKILIVDNRLWIKSVSFRSRRFSRNMIQTIFCCRPYQLITMGFIKEWPRIFHWAFWKKGLFIELKDGTSYYLGFSDADRVLNELNELLRYPAATNAENANEVIAKRKRTAG